MWRLILRNTVARRARLALTLLAVVLGVAFVTGSLVLTDTSRQLLDDQFRTATAGVDLTVRDAAAFDSAMGVEVQRDPLPPAVVERVRAVAGVAGAEPQVRGDGLLVIDGRPIVPSGTSLLASWAPAPVGAFTMRAGRPPATDGEVVVDAGTAGRHGIAIGDVVTVRAVETVRGRVVGLAGFGDRPGLPNSTVTLVSLPTAQRLLQLGTGVSEIAVTATPGTSTTDLQGRIQTALGEATEVSSSRDVAAAAASAAQNQVGYLQVMLLALAAAGLLAGAFLIANTFAIVITQRTHELAVLRSIGATGGQVVRSVLGEALVIGVTAAVLGLAAGVGTAAGLRNLAGLFGVALPDGPLLVSGRTVTVAFAVGVLVTVLAALGPARRAARVAPVEAMRRSSTSDAIGRARTVAGTVALAIGAVAVATAIAGTGGTAVLAAGAALLVGGLTTAGPALAPVLSRTLGRPLDAWGVPGRLARESATRAPRRTAATVTALALGLMLVSFTAVVATSVKASIQLTYRESITADYVVESARNEMLGGLPESVHHHIATLTEVAVASRLRYGHWKDGQHTRALTAVDPVTLPRVTSLRMRAGSLDGLRTGGVVLAERVAAQRGLSVGDTLAMTFSRTGDQLLTVVGLLRDRDAQALSTDYIVGLDTYARNYAEDVDASIFVRLAAGVGTVDARRAIEAAIAEAPTAQVRDQAAAVAGRSQTIERILGLVTALLLVSIVIALLGITNTLALSIVERTRQIGLLRAVGMTRGQLRTMVVGEAVLVSGIATVVGVGTGVALGAGTARILGAAAEAPVVLPGVQLALVAVIAVGAGLLAGMLPARRAARLDLLTAVNHAG